jgi:hypothetical protein
LSEFGYSGLCDCMIETFSIGMSEYDRNFHETEILVC